MGTYKIGHALLFPIHAHSWPCQHHGKYHINAKFSCPLKLCRKTPAQFPMMNFVGQQFPANMQMMQQPTQQAMMMHQPAQQAMPMMAPYYAPNKQPNNAPNQQQQNWNNF